MLLICQETISWQGLLYLLVFCGVRVTALPQSEWHSVPEQRQKLNDVLA